MDLSKADKYLYPVHLIVILLILREFLVVLINPRLGHLMVATVIPFISFFRLIHAVNSACVLLVAGIIYYKWLRGATKLNIQQSLLVVVWLFGCCVVLLPRSVARSLFLFKFYVIRYISIINNTINIKIL